MCRECIGLEQKWPTEVHEDELLRQGEATNWTMAVDTEEDYHCFVQKLLKKKAERANVDKWILESPTQQGRYREKKEL